MTYADYLEFERKAERKHEFLRGEVWAMAGGTPEHALIAANAGAELKAALRGKPCDVFNADLRVRIESTERSTYPDVTVVCGKREVASDVLSEGTEASDRGEKFANYQRIPSLREYVLISQKTRRVEVFSRTDDNVWRYSAYGKGSTVVLGALGVSLQVDGLYAQSTA
ncbi:MAG: Uma2 family endonuclease [Myxococcales bacterium]|nr:Uma2 family endonuclease [Myxococcales bacterium]